MIFALSDTLSLHFTTMLGVNVGFEIVTGQDFDTIEFPAKWSVMLNLFAFRITLTKYHEE